MAARALALIGALLLGSCGGERGSGSPRHVLLIVVDTLRADHALGGAAPPPGLAALAAEAVSFRRAIAPCSWTTPSIITLFTGRDLLDERLAVPAELPTLAELYRDAGWRTGAFVCSGLITADNGFDRGFQRFESLGNYSSDGKVIDWLESQPDTPTFTYVHLLEPHDPYGPPDMEAKSPANARRFGDLSEHALMQDPPALVEADIEQLTALAAEAGTALQPQDLEAVQRGRAAYSVDVLAADRRIAALVQAAEAAAGPGNAVIVVTADHGEGLWTRAAPRRGAAASRTRLDQVAHASHGSFVTPELVRVPLIVRAPHWAPQQVHSTVGLSDLAPTLLTLCGLPVPPHMSGLDLDRLRRAPDQAARLSPARLSSTRYVRSVVSHDGWQLSVPTAAGRAEQDLEPGLYDWNRDPGAELDLSARHPEVVARLSRWLDELCAAALSDGEAASAERTPENLRRLQQLGYLDDGVTHR